MTLTVNPVDIVNAAEKSGSPGLLARHKTWERIPLAEIAEVLNGFPFKSQSFNTDGIGLPLIRIRDIGRQAPRTYYSGRYDDRYEINKGDVIVGMDGDFRVDFWHGETALLNQRVCKITVRDPELYNLKFLRYVLQGYLDAIGSATSSVTVKHLSSRSLLQIPLPLPPIAEQRRIVDALEDNLSRLDAAERLIASAITRAEAVAKGVTSIFYGYTPQTGEGSAPVPPYGGTDDGVLPRIPETWSWRRLEDIAEVIGGVTKDAKKQSDPSFREVPYLRVANVQRGWLDLSEISFIRVNEKVASNLALRVGDVLLNEGGDRDKLGRGWIWEDQVPGAIHQNHVFRARIRGNAILPKLLSWYANSAARWFESNGKQSVNLASISLSKVKQLPVPVPPASEQARIVERIEDQLSVVSTATAISQRSLAKADALRRALLESAFTGKMIKQNWHDESASDLLKRIRTAHVAQRPSSRRLASRRSEPSARADASVTLSIDSARSLTSAVQQELPL